MRLGHTGVAGVLVVCAGLTVQAQIGSNEVACAQRWGMPLQTTADAAGVRTVAYGTNGLAVEAKFMDGKAQRLEFRRDPFPERDVQALLALNAPSMAWGLFRHTDPPDGLRQDVWIRSDEGAMAVFEAGRLTISTARWTQDAAQAPASASNTPLVETSAEPPAAPEMALIGFWQAKGTSRQAAMECTGGGDLKWTAMSDAGTREFRGRYVSLGPEKPLRFEVWRAARARDPLGLLVMGSDGSLAFNKWRKGSDGLTGFWPMDDGEGLRYGRVAAMPAWRASAPRDAPVSGDTRRQVLENFGKPRGSMTVGPEEILSYPWGQVFLETGRVVRVKSSTASK